MRSIILFSFVFSISVATAQTSGLIHTTRDFYFDIQTGCPADQLCIQDFSLILTFDIGVTMQDEIKEIGFNNAILSFDAKNTSKQSFLPLTFIKYDQQFIKEGKRIKLTFYPEKKPGVAQLPVIKCTFDGYVKERGGAVGTLVFYLPNGSTWSYTYY